MTYIYQKINLHCNLPRKLLEGNNPQVISVFGAMSDRTGDTLKFAWNPRQTHTTRQWNSGYRERMVESPTQTWEGLLTQYPQIASLRLKFFKIDCEGCEYAVIPLFSDTEWDAIDEGTSAFTYNRQGAHQHRGKYQSCMVSK